MEDMTNKVLANLVFGIQDASKQLQTLEQLAAETATRIQNQFAKANLLTGQSAATKTLTEEQARVQAILEQSELKKASILALGEARLTALQEREALKRQAIAEQEAAKLAILRQRTLAEEARLAERTSSLFGGSMFGRHLGWLATGAGIFAVIELLKQGVVDVEKGMKGLTTVLPQVHESQEEFNRAQKEAIDLMQKYGASLDEVMNAARAFGRMYKDVDTVMGLVNNSILMSVVDNVALEDAVRGNEAALAVYGKELKNFNEIMAFSNHVMDTWTRLSHETLASATDLINITERAAGSAKVAKTSFEELMGLGASAIRATGLPGANIGNMLKTVMAQLAAPTKEVEKAIEAVGVKVRDTNGALRSAYDILLDLSLATREATASQEELANAEKAAASGKFQYSKVAALMGQYDEIVKNTAKAINNQGLTLQMAAQQMDTLERKAKMLHATLVDMFAGVGDKGLRKVLKDLIDTINQFIIGLNNISTTFINAGLAIGAAVIGFRALNAVFNTLLPVVASLTGYGAAISGVMSAMATGAISAELGIEGLTAAITGLELATAGVTVIISALVAGLIYFIYKSGEAERKEQELIQTTKQNIAIHQQQLSQYQQTTDFLQNMAKRYSDLSARLKTVKEGSKEYNQITKDLQATREAILIVTDEETKRTLGLTDAKGQEKKVTEDLINKIVLLEQERVKSLNSQLAADARATQQLITNAINRVKAIEAEIGALQALQGQYEKGYSTLHIGKWDTGIKVPLPGKGLTSSAIENEIKKQQESLKAAKAEVEKRKGELQDLQLQIARNTLDTAIEHAASTPGSEKTKTKSESAKEAISKLQLELNNLERQLTINAAKFDTLNEKIKSGTATLQDWAEAQRLLRERSSLLSQEQAKLIKQNSEWTAARAKLNQNIPEQREQIDKLSESIAENTKKILENQQALQELKTKGYDDLAEGALNWLNHLESLDGITKKQQLDFLLSLDRTKLSLSEQWKLEEEIFKARNAYYDELKSKALEAIEAEAEASKRASEARIADLQAQLDLLDSQTQQMEEQLELTNALKAIKDAQTELQQAKEKLANVQAQKNTRVFQNGVWSYIADPEAVKEAQKTVEDAQNRLIDAQNNYNQLVEKIRRDQMKRELQAQIEHEKEIQQAKQDSYEKQKKDLEAAYQALKQQQDGWWKLFAETELANLQAYEQNITAMINRLKQQWIDYQRVMMEAQSMTTPVKPKASYASGGPITEDMVIQAHKGEYVLNSEDVKKLGGYTGINRLRHAVGLSDSLQASIGRSVSILSKGSVSNNHSTVSNDNRVVIENASFPNVVDASGLIRNLRQLANG